MSFLLVQLAFGRGDALRRQRQLTSLFHQRPFNERRCWPVAEAVKRNYCIQTAADDRNLFQYSHSNGPFLPTRSLHTTRRLYDLEQKSKVELTVEALKQEKESSRVAAASAVAVPEQKETLPLIVPKKTIWQKVVAEAKHYYHGFRLLGTEISISWGLLWKLIRGESLSRREHKQLVRTVSDIFRLVPFVVILIIPFAEFALPILLKFFPNMLPSTFEEKSTKEENIRKRLKGKLEMAKFLQETIHETALEHKENEKSNKAAEFASFFDRIRISGEQADNKDIMRFAKLFEDELTLDSLPRDVIVALCRLLEIGVYGLPPELLRFQLRMRLRNLRSDDKMIQMEGVDNLDADELQSACRARGMRSVGVSEQRLKSQLKQWLELSLEEKIPPSLLLLSRALYLPDNLSKEETIKSTIARMPEKLGDEVEVKLAEQEGAKVDYEMKRRLVREEQETIKREELERKEREASDKEAKAAILAKAPAAAAAMTEVLKQTAAIKDKAPEDVTRKDLQSVTPLIQEITKQDMEHIEDIIEKISKDKYSLLEQQDLKEEVDEYKEDIDELRQIPEASDLRESKAAQRLSKRVTKMLASMDKMMGELEAQKAEIKSDIKDTKTQVKALQKDDQTDHRRILDIVDEMDQKKDNMLSIEHLLTTMKQLSKIPDDDRLARVEQVLKMMDIDKDGNIELEHALKVLELIGEENFKMTPKQLEDVMDVLRKEDLLEDVDEAQKASSSATSSVPNAAQAKKSIAGAKEAVKKV
ncbi:LETM1 and EF-hand domain-containing protein 1, mitochondrial [Hypsibius exemplaris]|uniref:Mitochondrial proton/calcium exchanger protein n=1 Tax=Hypsibius exemplaris TaxID=2072580 RepID=A0A9X6NCR5_HYPEX|nr:LETM1 and EF-hand domain-containing protein 1, mitochondrial [Hypsibius exemplaris]